MTCGNITSENSDMYRSLTKHELVLNRVLIQLVKTIIRAGISAGISGLDENTDIVIGFDDSIIQDKEAEMQKDFQMLGAGIMRPDEFRAKWMGETLEEARKNLPTQESEVIY